jgi:4'-phosphopantetheinyl transferase
MPGLGLSLAASDVHVWSLGGRWGAPASDLRAGATDADAWGLSDSPGPRVRGLPDVEVAATAIELPENERVRASRFRDPMQAARFLDVRRLIRTLLGEYLSGEPVADAFVLGPFGKPGLSSEPPVHFSLSYAAGAVLFAVAREPLGIDVEMHKDEDLALMVDMHFTGAEARQWRSLPEPYRVPAFFRAWTAKEAILKQRGDGLALGLGGVPVDADPRRPLRLLGGSTHNALSPDVASLCAIPVAPGHSAALAWSGSPSVIGVGRAWLTD